MGGKGLPVEKSTGLYDESTYTEWLTFVDLLDFLIAVAFSIATNATHGVIFGSLNAKNRVFGCK